MRDPQRDRVRIKLVATTKRLLSKNATDGACVFESPIQWVCSRHLSSGEMHRIAWAIPNQVTVHVPTFGSY